MRDETIKTILVDLDCLLDTRLSTVHLINPEAVPIMLDKNVYHDRKKDDYYKLTKGMISNETFIDKYYDRDKETLKASVPTNMLKLLHEITYTVGEQTISEPDVKLVEVIVNIHPYKLNYEEKEVLINSFSVYLFPETKISIIDKPISYLSPKVLASFYDGYITYEFDQWYLEHQEELIKNPMPRNIIFAPAIFVKEEPTAEELLEQGIENLTAFEIMEKALLPYVSLEFLKVDTYSLTNK